MNKNLSEMTNSEIWDGWCGSASPSSDEGTFTDLDDAIAYVRDRVRDWGNEPAEMENDEVTRYISDLTENEIIHIAKAILAYSQANR